MDSPEKVSLRGIITSFLKDTLGEMGTTYSNIRVLQNRFNKLIEKFGCSTDMLKANGRTFNFDESEIPFLRAIISQLYYNKGIMSEIVNSDKEYYTSKQFRELIQNIIDEGDKIGLEEADLQKMVEFFDVIFGYSILRIIENCHKIIDYYTLNLKDLTYTQQFYCLLDLEDGLKKDFAARLVQMAINAKDIAEQIELSKDVLEDNIGCQDYQGFFNCEPEISNEYIARDRDLLKKIQEDDALRQYIETALGKKAEDIFNYAAPKFE